MRHFLSIFLLSILFTKAIAQVDIEIYTKAKNSFNAGNYQVAKQYFQTLVNDDPKNKFNTYASFYIAVCNFREGQERIAQEGFKNILLRNSTWENIDEVKFWLAKTSVSTNNYRAALEYFQSIANTSILQDVLPLIESMLKSINSIGTLEELYQDFETVDAVGKRFATVLSESKIDDNQKIVLERLKSQFEISSKLPLLRRERYKIAVLLPFMYESLSDTRVISRNKFVMDIYSGMELAVAKLEEEGVLVSLHPYDTKRSREATEKILALQELKSYDLIVGPLYPEPFQVVSEFSQANKINMFNPVSSNKQIIADNKFSFLLKPTYETMAWASAQFAIENFKDNKKALIIHDDDERFESMAKLYGEILSKNGFEVISSMRVSSNNSRDVLEGLTKTFEYRLNQSEKDSISKMQRRFIKGKLAGNGFDTLYFYEERYKIPRQSVGHIFAASTNTVVAANVVGGVEVRGDRIPIIGMGEWLNYNVLTLEQLERLGVMLLHPSYLNFEDEEFNEISNMFTSLYRQPPSINQYNGFDLIYLVGKLMNEHGVYFQQEIEAGQVHKGKVFTGYQYGYAQDNQLVPIVKMQESVLQIVNNQNYHIVKE